MTHENKIILIVEDEISLQKAVSQKFERKGMKVHLANTVSEALAIMEHQGRVDLVWLDHYLIGKETGFDFVMALKGKETWAKIPVVLVSNTASVPMLQKYREQGVSKLYIKSDYSLDEIFNETIKMLL